MPKIISIHSFRGGTGKSNTTANLAALLAQQGKRVCVIDTDIQSPGIHVLFGLDGEKVTTSLNDFLWHGRPIEQVALDVTPQAIREKSGKIYLVPSSIKPGEITRVMREGYDARQLTEGFRGLLTELKLDYLLIDTHPGLGEETLLSLVISNTLIIVMRPDQQDYEGTGVTVRIAQELKVPNILLLVNKAPSSLEPAALAQKIHQAYGCRVIAVMPHSDEMMELASRDLFTLKFPNHPITDLYREVAALLG
jgi:MinD-like ATPase involved in chromosome partitioning or flagellar assembly